MGYYVKVAEWNRKEYLKAKIRTTLKNVLIRNIEGKFEYEDVEKLSNEILQKSSIKQLKLIRN